MRYLVAAIICIFSTPALCQLSTKSIVTPVVKKPTLPASQQPINTWKKDVVNTNNDSINSYRGTPIVPANYQASLPQPLTTDGLFDLLILMVHPGEPFVKPIADDMPQH